MIPDNSVAWEDIPSYDGYKVSIDGRVYSTKSGKELRQYDKKGYLHVFLYNKNGGRKDVFVHRLVATAFIPNPNNEPQINHKDENTKNNNAMNLEWCSAKYNSNYGHHRENMRKATEGEKNPFYGKTHSSKSKHGMRNAKLGKPSKRKREVTINGIDYESVSDAMRKLNVCTRKIYRMIGGE